MLNINDVIGYDSITQQLNGEKAKETKIGLLVTSAHFWQRSKRIQSTGEVGIALPWILAIRGGNQLWPMINLMKAGKIVTF